MNLTLPSLNGGSLEITLTVPLIQKPDVLRYHNETTNYVPLTIYFLNTVKKNIEKLNIY